MSMATSIGKLYLSAAGKSVSRQSIKVSTNVFRGIVKGQPKGVKKQFYKTVTQFLQNPENKKAEQLIRTSVENSKGVAEIVEKQTAMKLEEVRQMAVESTKKTVQSELEIRLEKLCKDAGCTETYTRDYSEGTVEALVDFQRQLCKESEAIDKRLAAFPISQSIIGPVRTHHIINSANNSAIKELRYLSIKPPTVTLTEEQVGKIYEETMKEVAKDALTIAKRKVTYPINGALSLFAPKKVKVLLKDGIVKLPKDLFGKQYYARLLETKGLVGRAPSEIIVTDKSAGLTVAELLGSKAPKCEGGFNPFLNNIQFTKEFSSLPRSTQANMLAHELKHFEQVDSVIRTFGIDRYIEALKKMQIELLKKKAMYSGKTEKELRMIVEKMFRKDNLEGAIRSAFKPSVLAQKTDPLSEEGIKAKDYLNAIGNYVGANTGFITTIPKEYLNNALEKEAYSIGRKSGFWTRIFEELNLENI